MSSSVIARICRLECELCYIVVKKVARLWFLLQFKYHVACVHSLLGSCSTLFIRCVNQESQTGRGEMALNENLLTFFYRTAGNIVGHNYYKEC